MGEFELVEVAMIKFVMIRIRHHLVPPEGEDGQADNIPVQEQAELRQGSGDLLQEDERDGEREADQGGDAQWGRVH